MVESSDAINAANAMINKTIHCWRASVITAVITRALRIIGYIICCKGERSQNRKIFESHYSWSNIDIQDCPYGDTNQEGDRCNAQTYGCHFGKAPVKREIFCHRDIEGKDKDHHYCG